MMEVITRDEWYKWFPQIPEPFTGEMLAFLLTNALKYLTVEQQASLCADIYVRSGEQGLIDRLVQERLESKFKCTCGYAGKMYQNQFHDSMMCPRCNTVYTNV